ncbi:MAG: tetratricopeptide repeat protein [Bacteroidaceae bacterium]|nr:tetratricopeptide repeat protein [Bacteroidaceae bacterium]
MDDIKAMGDTLPKVAMQRLDSIKPLFENECEYMRNKFALLDIRLHDKAYITHTSIKPIEDVCRYFEENGTAAEQQEAYYYMGSVYRDLNDYPNAVTCFLKSAEIAENNSDIDSALWKNAYSQLSYLYNQQFNYSSALDAAIKALDIAEKFQTVNERTYMSVSSSYHEIADTIQTIKYADLALQQIEAKGICPSNADIIAYAIGKYSVYGRREKAERCYWLLAQLPKKARPFNYLTNIAMYYERFISVDIAAVAKSELYNTTKRIESKYDAARWLTRYYVAKGEYEKAAGCAINFINANEAVIDKRTLEHTTNAKNFYQYKRDKEEEMAIMEKAARDRFNLLLGISVSVIIISVVALLYYHRKKQLLDIILSKEKNIRQAKAMVASKDAELEKEKASIEQKEKELATLDTTNSKLTKQLEAAENDFRMLVAQNRELTRLTLMNDIACDAKDIIEKVKRASEGKYHLSDDEWKELLGAVDKLYPEFTHEVQSKFKRINEPLLRVCYLLKIGLTGPQIVNLTGYPRQTVWVRIKRIEAVLSM